MNKKIIVALFGAAGAGKDALQKEIVFQSPNLFHKIISSTTRLPREYEKDGVDYIFLTDNQYKEYLEKNCFIEHTDFRDWHYGTLFSSIEKGKFNIGVFNISGVKQLLKLPSDDYHIIPIYIMATQKTRLLRQLNREEFPDCDEIIRRYQTDTEDFASSNLNFWHLMEFNENYEISYAAASIIKDIYEHELEYFLSHTGKII